MDESKVEIHQNILTLLARYGKWTDLETLSDALGLSCSRRTLQRRLRELIESGQIEVDRRGRSTRYRWIGAPDGAYESFIPLSAESLEILKYVRRPLWARQPVAYERDLLDSYKVNKTWYLDEVSRSHLRRIGQTGKEGLPAGTHGRQILDRLLIDLSWSSSRLEGNTYSRLDTERLIEQGKIARGKDAQETQMILNHKRAIELLVEDADEIGFNRYTVLNLHGLLSENLLADSTASGRLRTRAVEIGHSVYQPTNVPQLLEESFDLILEKATGIGDPYEQSFFILVHIPYLQPFEDVNKRTARVAANISLVKHNLCLLTFLDVPERAFIDAVLGLYELGRIELLRDLFIWAYERSTHQYTQVKASLQDPDPMRLKYREQIYEVVGNMVRQLRVQARDDVRAYADRHIEEAERETFVSMVMDDLRRLHEGVIARYRLKPSEFAAWQSAIRKELKRGA
jgi:DNA-binding Lrp family transcriptional regulator